MDSWEDEAPSSTQSQSNHQPKPAQSGGTTLNVNAPTFSFNPGASSFKPFGQAAPTPQPESSGRDAAAPRTEPPAESDVPMAEPPSTAAQEEPVQTEDTDMAEPPDRGRDSAEI